MAQKDENIETRDEMGDLSAALGYLPAGGLQSLFCLMGFFNKNPLVKFHSVQALSYWILVALSIVPLTYIIASPDAPGEARFVFLIGGSLVLLLGFPVWFAYRAFKGEVFHVPLIGPLAERISGLKSQ